MTCPRCSGSIASYEDKLTFRCEELSSPKGPSKKEKLCSQRLNSLEPTFKLGMNVYRIVLEDMLLRGGKSEEKQR